MEIIEGKIITTTMELNSSVTFRQIDAVAAKALRDVGVMQSPDDMRSAVTIAQDMGILTINDTQV